MITGGMIDFPAYAHLNGLIDMVKGSGIMIIA